MTKKSRSDPIDFMEEVAKMYDEQKKMRKVDWEDLAKNLEKALNAEIKENEENHNELNRLQGIEYCVKNLEGKIDEYKIMLIEQRGVIGYLETKIKNLEA